MWDYKEAKGICVRPLSPITTELGYFNHCKEMPQKVSNIEVEDEFFSGKGRFYYYDIKLDSRIGIDKYKKFLTEFLRRGETDDCFVHISNVIWHSALDKDLVSVYDLPHLLELIEVVTSISQNIYFELDDKRFKPYSIRELTKVVNLCRKLEGIPNILLFLLNESMHTRGRRDRLFDTARTIASYDLYYKVLLAKEEEK